MLLSFLKNWKRVTRHDFAQKVWHYCTQASERFCSDFSQLVAMTGRELSEEQQIELSKEVMAIHLWATCHILRSEKEILCILHKFQRHEKRAPIASLSQDELVERYDKYYAAWNSRTDGPPWALGSIMLNHMLNRGHASRESLNAMLIHAVLAQVFAWMEAVAETRKRCDIMD